MNAGGGKKVAVMQPYLFPYIGYLQLVSASDIFIFYDDVDFIKGGWINRNKIAINGKENLFTVPLDSASPNKKINETFIHKGWRRDKLLKKIRLAYANAPMFDKVFPVVKSVVENASESISMLAESSVRAVSDYLGINVQFHRSSDLPISDSLGRADRLIALAKHFDAQVYVNMEGGKELYDKQYFDERGIKLLFLIPSLVKYEQYKTKSFKPGLSVIDVLMSNEPAKIMDKLVSYELS